ncbi:MAG TPA: hypothetical protein VD838_09405 [Anaeromyxobacteraceae bacterium]|nr:hypothetical protein [Anaeromyxobacteraceae bacterium]
MVLTGALLALALTANAEGDRLLLCRPRIVGDPALARGEAVGEAARKYRARFLDYGVACEDAAEGGRAARRAGLRHAVTATAEGRTEGSRYVLALADAEREVEIATQVLEVAPGEDPGPRLRTAFARVLGELPRAPARERHLGAWSVVGGGVAALAAGIALAVSASSDADRADAARTPEAHLAAVKDWEKKRNFSRVALGAGGAALAAGLTWRFAF